ncbi:unnamed protein product [Meganyctiphanes norvegica]|uniref:Sulfatase N-terminal domain-containing protein n=1 Tax=Meganyctiphanes norvegica TaxID=48144 RepID=A0AAV2RHH5_MEGNR
MVMAWEVAIHLLLQFLNFSLVASTDTPNIVFIFADDLGWNHVSWNNPSVLTPHMQVLAETGVILDQSYVQPLCTPSRSALMTGMYPFHLGRQHGVLAGPMPTGLSRNYTLLPEKLSSLGYATHMVGKWHLGMCDWSYTPTYRGFDSFYGFYSGSNDYYSHNTSGNGHGSGGFDFRDNEMIAFETAGTYATELFTEKAVEIIENHQTQENPFFLYIAHENVHFPYQVPKEYYDLYPDVEDDDTHIALGMVSAMDKSVGAVVDALKSTGQYDNTVIIFSTDNGGVGNLIDANYPLRGNKAHVWEGGTRGAGFIYSSLLQDIPRVYNGLMHVTDWHNTLLDIAGSQSLPDNDGFSQWEALKTGQSPSPRDTLIYNIDETDSEKGIIGAIRVGDYKYIMGESDKVNNEEGPWLFDLSDDPNESMNLVLEKPVLANELEELLLGELSTLVPADLPKGDPAGDPSNWGGVVSPGWCPATTE